VSDLSRGVSSVVTDSFSGTFENIKMFFIKNTDYIKFNGYQFYSNSETLKLFLENYDEPENTHTDKEHFRQQITACYNLLIDTLEHFIGALAAKAKNESKVQEKWLIGGDNKVFVTAEKLKKLVEAKLDEDSFTDLRDVEIAINNLINAAVSISKNCEALQV